MSRRLILPITLALLLVAAVIFAVRTAQPPATRPVKHDSAAAAIDDRLLISVRELLPLAQTAAEQELANAAYHLADHEFDQSFAIALREAASTPPPASGPLHDLAERVAALKQRVSDGEAQAARLEKAAAKDEATGVKLDLARAQLTLDRDELAEAQSDLARQGGDRRANLQRLLKEHEDADKTPPHTALASAPPLDTLLHQVRALLDLRGRADKVQAVRQQTLTRFAAHYRARFVLSSGAASPTAAPATDADAAGGEEEAADAAEVIERLRRLSDQKKTLAEIDQCIQDTQSLAATLDQWRTLLEARRVAIVHVLLISAALILAVVLAVTLASLISRQGWHQAVDRRRARRLHVIVTVASQVIGVLLIAFIVFGQPTQLSTMIGFATAGLTVVLKDFIVAFFGWFMLMGRNGLHLGDWVEIEGVSGEVIEIGLLKTVLLEIGNTSGTGHPTGRRVAFGNKFAIEDHYFNFSTAGQWLWDELQLTLPRTADAYRTSVAVRDLIDRETASEARLAEQDWEAVTRKYETRAFSACPAVDLRPSATGIDVVVRYITRAPNRFEVKSHLFQKVVELLHSPQADEVGQTPTRDPLVPPA